MYNSKKEKPSLVSIIRKIANSPFSAYPSLEFGDSLKDIKTYWLKFSFRF